MRLAVAFAVAALATAAVASVVQTQINLAAIDGLGVPTSAATRASVTAQDLARFGPVMAAIAAGALLPAFVAAALVGRMAPPIRAAAYAAAGVVGLAAAFWIMGFFSPMPTLVAAVRGATGFAAMCATGAIGGWAFAKMTQRRPAEA